MAPSRALTRLARRSVASVATSTSHGTTTTTIAATTAATTRRACYHSYDRPAPAGEFGGAEHAILSAAYRHVPEHGFTQRALALGARDAGYPDISPGVLPDGAFGLIRHHLVTQREALGPRSRELFGQEDSSSSPSQQQQQQKQRGGADKIEALAWERLRANGPVNHRWQEALAVMAQPSRAPASLRELALLADEIEHLAGPGAVDATWYARRAALAASYAASELFMTADASPGFADTRAFLRRRLDEARGAGSALAGLGSWVGFGAAAGVNVLRSKGVRI